jgi:hypothetical protein
VVLTFFDVRYKLYGIPVIREKVKFMSVRRTGLRTVTKRIRIMRIPIGPAWFMKPSNRAYCMFALNGRSAFNIFDPSSGGIGKRLRSAKMRLMYTIMPARDMNAGERNSEPNRIIRPNRSASVMLMPGPAAATSASP